MQGHFAANLESPAKQKRTETTAIHPPLLQLPRKPAELVIMVETHAGTRG